ncbi:hypothetical protein [Flammeovirga sp. SJP92]|uniref:hypothetical protein n=1 Tax=Flammeovirga sp. SJP92 TaxID=1775430 RepID=UPI0007879722|nr:hypothetical protein [Flammeovirga sp. SJP92]KXX67724.1 hypothetical protein AVL50_24975 [Flammeovirga sp. SJP92]
MNKILTNILLIAFILTANVVVGQEEENLPYGRFSTDSIMLGEEVKYTLRYEHSADAEVLFPDSTFNFAPFELLDKTYFPTRTTNGISVDCVEYTLSTYDIDSVYELGLPVWVYNQGEKDSIVANLDGIFFKDLIQVMPDSAQLYANVDFVPVHQEFNYPYLLIFIGVLVVIALVVLLGFGGKIKEYYRKKKLQKRYVQFLHNYSSHLDGDMTVNNVEESVVIWKSFMASVIAIPIQAMTSKEAGLALHSKELEAQLKVLDRVIYAGQGEDEAKAVLEGLKEWAKQGQEYAMTKPEGAFVFKK